MYVKNFNDMSDDINLNIQKLGDIINLLNVIIYDFVLSFVC